MSKHTPGPWLQWAGTNIIIRLHSGEPRSEDLRICEVATNTRNDEGAANARLIAAAPELLEALESIASMYDYEASCGDLASRLYEARCIANVAIAKATGEA